MSHTVNYIYLSRINGMQFLMGRRECDDSHSEKKKKKQ